jgi:selenocysteine-specific elongation factor
LKEDSDVLALALASSLTANRIAQHPGGWSAAGWTVRLASDEDRLTDAILSRVRAGGWAPPGVDDLANSVCQPRGRVEKLLRLLTDRGELLTLADGIFMHREAIDASKQVALQLFARSPSFTTMQFRDALAVSRKYAVPLLDHLDRIRFTVRSGHDRTPGVEARKRMK